MAGRLHRLVNHSYPSARILACTICFGIAGFIWSLPRFHTHRLRRAATCSKCASHRKVRGVAVYVVAVLLLAGAGARGLEALSPQLVCNSEITRSGEIRAEQPLHIAPPPAWDAARHMLVAPISGIGVIAGRAMGMESCARQPLLVMFRPPPDTSSGGSMLGDVFVTWMRDNESAVQAYGIGNEGAYQRFGPNISRTETDARQLGLHESRHVNQWAAANVAGGPFAFPAAYAIDEALFPGSRNHFERAAGLEVGGYPPPPDNWPDPDWPLTIALALLAGLIWRRRIRWLCRISVTGRSQVQAHAPGHCPVHTPGWKAVRNSGGAGTATS